MGLFGIFGKKKKETLDQGLERSSQSIFSKITKAIAGKSKVDDEVLDNLEEVLITSDVGVETTLKIIERIEARVARDKYVSTSELNNLLRDEIASLLTENNSSDNDDWDLPTDHKPYVILVVGVNGVGKTTTIGKLAYQFKNAGKRSISVPPTLSGPPLWTNSASGVREWACLSSSSRWVPTPHRWPTTPCALPRPTTPMSSL